MTDIKGRVGTSRSNVARVLTSSAGSTVVNGVLGLVVLPRVLHGLDVTRYGEWATITAVLAVGQLAATGVTTEVGRRVASANGQGDPAGIRRAVSEGTTVLAGFALIFEIVGVLLAHPAVNLVFTRVSPGQRGQLALLLMFSVSLVAISLTGSSYFGVLGGLQRSDYGNWSAVAASIVSAAATVVGIAVGMGLWALLLADYLQLIVGWSGAWVGIRRLAPHVRLALTKVPRSVVLGLIGAPGLVVFASASDLFDMQVDKLVLAHQVGPAAAGMFQIGTTLVTAGKGVAIIPLGVLFAGTAELHATRPGRLRRLESFSWTTAQALAAVIAGGFLLFSPVFLRVWLGPGYGDAALSMRLLSIAVLINVWGAPWFFFAVGRGRYRYVLISASVTLTVNALSTVILTSTIGLPGALLGSVAGAAAGTAAGWLVLLRWERRAWLRPALVPSGLVALVVLPLLAVAGRVPASWLGLIMCAGGYVAVCGAVLLLFGALPVALRASPGRLPRLVWRDQRPADTQSEPRPGWGD